jgi:hypothetical protein
MVEIHFSMSKQKFISMIRQLRKRKHRLAGELHPKRLRGETDVVAEADFMECELILETLANNAFEPPVPFKVSDEDTSPRTVTT